MDYREITLKDVEYQKALIKKYETELATLPERKTEDKNIIIQCPAAREYI